MFADLVKDVAFASAHAIELLSIVVLVAGTAMSLVLGWIEWRRSGSETIIFDHLRARLGHAILLSLELLIVADILRTITVELTFAGLGPLALIVLIRTFLSFALEVEIEGRWPWAARPGGDRRTM